MAIAKLETVVIHRVQDGFGQNCYQVTPTTDKTVDKINEIIDYLTRMDEDIKDHIVEKVEQEPNKVELVPLDVEKIMSEIRLRCPLTMPWNYGIIIEILSQYGVPTQQPVIDWENPIVSIDHGKGIEDQTCRVVSVKDDKGKTYVIDICQYSELAEKQFFTPDYVNDRVEDNSERIQPLGEKSIIKMFLRDNGLIEE